MAIDRFDFDAVTEADINQLIANGVAECYRLEFKRETYSTNDSAKREFLKDVTAFADSAGGRLVIGIAETDSIATSAHPISVAQADTEILRMESLLRDGVEPRIAGGCRSRRANCGRRSASAACAPKLESAAPREPWRSK